jgi:hypothetical protein
MSKEPCKCPHCGEFWHVMKRQIDYKWVTHMPPKFCPGCGGKIGKKVD